MSLSTLSVIIPSYNEPNIHEFVEEIDALIFPEQIIVCNDRYGRGKGWSLREAIQEAKGDYILFIDGDRDIKPYEINKLLPYMFQYDIVVGRKELPIRKDRKILTFLSRLYIKYMFGLNVDTQTGIKCFNYKPKWTTDGWSFDLEILYKAKQMGKSMIEIPILATVTDTKSGKDIWLTLLSSLKIRFPSLFRVK